MKRPIIVFCILIGVCHAFWKQLTNLAQESLNNLIFSNRCIEDLGCFHTGPPFYHPLHRPISLPPTSQPITKFFLFTPTNPDKNFELEPTEESLQNSSFNSEYDTKFIIHGFLSKIASGGDRHTIKNAFLGVGNFNIIMVDWSANNGRPYAQAVSNTRVAGACVAKLINFLVDKAGITPQSVHVIGHSLGSHVAGYIGERVPNLGRITGLDPAGPFFQWCAPEVRLDPEDALFVDVIHTDGAENLLGGLGMNTPVGHMDFYPNGGILQPGCVSTCKKDCAILAAVNATTQLLNSGCDHSRAVTYFRESISSTDCRFLSVLCDSYEEFKEGKCLPENSTVTEMGFHARTLPALTVPAKFYLRTNGRSPYCQEDSINDP